MSFFDFSLDEGLSDKIMHAGENTLSFLNEYGADRLVAELRHLGNDTAEQRGHGIGNASWLYQDLTGDGVAEFAFVAIDVYVMGCRNGTYETLLRVHPDWNIGDLVEIADSRDLNLDGVPELVVAEYGGWHTDVYVHEWNGQSFDLLGQSEGLPYLYMQGGVGTGPTEFDIVDLDTNGTDEFVFRGGIPTNFDRLYFGPWRVRTDVYAWNGDKYALSEQRYSAPEYRFQAVQDGDRAMLAGRYEDALVLFQTAIFSDTLEWWSPERSANTAAKNEAQFQGQALPTPPSTNTAEYSQLAAYSRYRILLLHGLQGSPNEAKIVYDTLLTKFPVGSPGHPYAELATSFWGEYGRSHDMRAACNKAIEYASAHPEILVPLGSSYHGWQSLNYKPPDICLAP